MNTKIAVALIIGICTIIAALITTFRPASTPKNNSITSGDNSNVVQDVGGDVTIDQSVVNELTKLRELDAKSFQQSLVSGCGTMVQYFEEKSHFNVDSIDTLVGGFRARKDQFISFFGPEAHQEANEHYRNMSEPYLDFMQGIQFLYYSGATAASMRHNFENNPEMKKHIDEGNEFVKGMAEMMTEENMTEAGKEFIDKMNEAQGPLLEASYLLCDHFESLEFRG